MAARHEESNLIAEFMQLTGANRERSQFYLQSANWQLHAAVDTFFDNDEFVSEDRNVGTDELSSVDTASGQRMESPHKVENPIIKKKVKTSSKSDRFKTIGQLNEESSSEEEGQAFFAGGSETSGQQILGPKKTKSDITKEIFESAKQHGAVTLPEQGSSDNKKVSNIFKGAGFKLGSDIQPSKQITPSLAEEVPNQLTKHVAIKFWKNGFSVDNGPLRNFNDPANKDFLSSISKGDVPAELKRLALNGEVHVDMEDHGDEEYIKPKEIRKCFEGVGHTLGSPTPQMTHEVSVKPPSSNNILQSFSVDDSKPVTTIQIRLTDGTRLVSKFNYDNTIEDIENLVRNARPLTAPFYLMTTFPNKVLNDLKMTISDAKLFNAVIVQRLK
nr:NSFL1 cofactor p47 [Hydra vulgaris]